MICMRNPMAAIGDADSVLGLSALGILAVPITDAKGGGNA